MHMRSWLTLLCAGGVALVVMTVAHPVASTAAAAGAAVAASPAADDDPPGSPINGRKVFLRENCYICHGGRGGGGMCPSLRDNRPDFDDVEEAVLNGTRTGMPSFRGRVTRQEIADLAAYLRTLRTTREPVFTHWWEPGIPAR